MIAAAVLVVPLTAQAATPATPAEPTATVGTAAWTPQIYPLLSGEWVRRGVPTSEVDSELAICSWASGIACVAVGEGDGGHSIFHLFQCDTRTLSNFVDALSVRNNQTGGAEVWFRGPNYQFHAPADGSIRTFPDWATYDFTHLDIC
ncbi:hypothetical protein ACQEVI_02035 [Promicromonospora sp. CA-289599]|uniref:hypothetical protein n=1 Tax=Promicromonospora sp. CA-289599 TaxID=3240014 RepID=UPI003D8D2406